MQRFFETETNSRTFFLSKQLLPPFSCTNLVIEFDPIKNMRWEFPS